MGMVIQNQYWVFGLVGFRKQLVDERVDLPRRGSINMFSLSLYLSLLEASLSSICRIGL